MAGNDETLRLKILADIDKAKRDLASLQKQADELEDPIKVKADTSSIGAFTESVKTNMAGAEGAMGKVKAAGSTMLDGLTQMGPLAMAGAGAAVGAFAVKAVHEFESVAKAALDMGAATGLSTEQASQWIAVADDFGIGADQIETAFGKVTKSLDSGKWEQYGIATRDAAGHARDANAIIADALGTLSEISNETERARVGNELFGKGYANLAPLIGKTTDEYKDMLGAVSDGQTITDAEADRAEDMRLAEDRLSDALRDVTIAFGEMVAEAAPAIDLLAAGVEKLSGIPTSEDEGIAGYFGAVADAARNTIDPFHSFFQSYNTLRDLFGGGKQETIKKAALDFDGFNAAMGAAAATARSTSPDFVSAFDSTIDSLVDFKGAVEDGEAALASFYDSQRAAADSSYAVEKSFDDLIENIQGYGQAVVDAEGDTRKLKDVQEDTRQTAIKYADAQVQAAQDTADAGGEALSAADSHKVFLRSLLEATAFMDGPQKAAMIDYIARVEGIPPEKVTAVLADPDNQSIDGAAAAIDEAARDRDAEINVSANVSFAESQMRAAISRIQNGKWNVNVGVTAVAAGTAAPVAPIGPTQHGAVTVAPAANVTNNITLNTRATAGRELTRELDRWARLNGRSRR